MVEYSLLFVASVIVALIVVFLCHELSDAGKAFYRAILPSSKSNSTIYREEKVATSVNSTQTPWGWKGERGKARQRRVQPAPRPMNVPWGWKGNDGEIRNHGPKSSVRDIPENQAGGLDSFLKQHGNETDPGIRSSRDVGWPYREEKFDFAGKPLKFKRKATLKRTNLKTAGKPWGW